MQISDELDVIDSLFASTRILQLKLDFEMPLTTTMELNETKYWLAIKQVDTPSPSTVEAE